MESMAYRDGRGTYWHCGCGLCPMPDWGLSGPSAYDRVSIKYQSENEAAEAGWIYVNRKEGDTGFWVCPKCK